MTNTLSHRFNSISSACFSYVLYSYVGWDMTFSDTDCVLYSRAICATGWIIPVIWAIKGRNTFHTNKNDHNLTRTQWSWNRMTGTGLPTPLSFSVLVQGSNHETGSLRVILCSPYTSTVNLHPTLYLLFCCQYCLSCCSTDTSVASNAAFAH